MFVFVYEQMFPVNNFYEDTKGIAWNLTKKFLKFFPKGFSFINVPISILTFNWYSVNLDLSSTVYQVNEDYLTFFCQRWVETLKRSLLSFAFVAGYVFGVWYFITKWLGSLSFKIPNFVWLFTTISQINLLTLRENLHIFKNS